MLFDTDVLIWLLRGNAKAARRVEQANERAISVVSHMELIQGVRNREELRLIRSFLADLDFRTTPLNENIGHRAVVYMEEHALKSSLCLADALLAATAVENGLILCTGNQKHFRLITELQLKPFVP
jgi:predicted nucleic acid-binding protein